MDPRVPLVETPPLERRALVDSYWIHFDHQKIPEDVELLHSSNSSCHS